ncbi:MAG TPA: NnrS family protein [Burkholderiales bacterium]|nr:NnrS family protein [Burkholderiales bacterium]
MVQPINIHKSVPLAAPGEVGRWRILTAAPHRLMFLLGVTQIVLSLLWWSIDLLGRYAQWYSPIQWSVPSLYAHAFLMMYAVFPLFVFGFTLTSMPMWTKQPVQRGSWVTAGVLFAIGIVVMYVGLALSTIVVAMGVLFYLAGWLVVWGALLGLVVRSRGKDVHAVGIVCLLGVGAVAVGFFAVSLITGDWLFADIARRLGIWLFLLPLFMIVSHRLIPFFSSRIIQDYVMYRPRGSLSLLFVGCCGHVVLEWFDLSMWTWLLDLPMAAWVGYLAYRWGVAHSFRAPLLAMLHSSLVALAIALTLYGIASFAALLGAPGIFGQGPLHALAIGYFAAKTVGMVSRVSLGHSGRALEADPLTWRCFQAVLLVAVLRVVSEMTFIPYHARLVLLLVSAALWLAVLIPWSFTYAKIYFSTRSDGKAG